MKIEKAIEILHDTTHQRIFPFCSDRNAAISLGIEALKRYQSLKLSEEYTILKPLPGED